MKTWLAALVAATSVSALFWPGTLDIDGLSQLTQARNGRYGDWFPPAMAALWKPLDWLLPGPGLLLVLQNSLFFSGVALICRRGGWGAWGVLLVCVFPFVPVWMGTISKDSLMCAALVATLGLLESRAWPIPAFLSAAVRHRSELALLPLLLTRRRGLAFIAICAAAYALNVGLRDERQYPSQQVLLHDLAALGSNAVPGLQERYDPWSVDTLIMGPGAIPARRDAESMAALRSAWWDALRTHPSDYAAHRLAMFGRMLGLTGEPMLFATQGIPANALGLADPEAPLRSGYVTWLRKPYVRWAFRPWIWLLGTAWLAWRSRERALVSLAASGWLYTLAYLPTLPSPQFRYGIWACFGFPLALVLAPRQRVFRLILPRALENVSWRSVS